MRRFAKWLARESLALLPVWLFFVSAFGLLELTRSVALARYGIQGPGFSEFFIGSLIIAKVFLVLDKLAVMNRLDRLPLIYGALWKTAILTVGSLAVKYLEDLVHLLRAHRGFAPANRELLFQMGTLRYLVLTLWLVILLFAYCAARELIRSWGKDRFLEAFFGIRHRFD